MSIPLAPTNRFQAAFEARRKPIRIWKEELRKAPSLETGAKYGN